METQTIQGNAVTDTSDSIAAYEFLTTLPEYADKKEAITAATKEIVELFDIDPLLFDDPSATFIMASIADRWSRAQSDEEREFLHDAVTLLAHKHSQTLETVYDLATSAERVELPDHEEQRIYDSYTNKQLTHEINENKDVLFANIKRKIGITEDNEDDYEIIVLNIATEGSLVELPVSISGNDYTTAELDRKVYKDWKQGLLTNAQTLEKELQSGALPMLWVSKKPGSEKRILCLDVPTAERLLHEDIDKQSSASEDGFVSKRLQLQSLAEHEYVHTQGGMSPDMENYFGIALEERRAEYFSGDKNGYLEIKRFLADVKVVTGLDVKQLFDSAPKGGDAHEVYMKIAEVIGLSSTLELLMTYPNNYLQPNSNTLMKGAHTYLGGFDGFIMRQLVSPVGQSRSEQIEAYISERAAFFKDKEYLAQQIKAQGNTILVDMALAKNSSQN